MRIIRLYKEIANYIEFKRLIKKESKNSPKWEKFRLRIDWINRIYTVINLPPEITQSKDFPVEGRPAYIMEDINPINNYLGYELNLNEITTIGMEPIKGTNSDSYLVVWFFLWRELTLLYALRLIFIFSLLIYAAIKYEKIYSFINIYIEKLLNLI